MGPIGSTERAVDLRPLRATLEALDPEMLDETGRSELRAMLSAALQAVIPDRADWTRLRARACPRVVAGLECQAEEESFREEGCICGKYQSLRVLDHYAMSTTAEGRVVLTSEPYDPDAEALADFIRECSELDLEVQLSGESSYYPGPTMRIVLIGPKTEAEDL